MKQHEIASVREDGFSQTEQMFCGVCSVCDCMVACDEFGISDDPCTSEPNEPDEDVPT